MPAKAGRASYHASSSLYKLLPACSCWRQWAFFSTFSLYLEKALLYLQQQAWWGRQ